MLNIVNRYVHGFVAIPVILACKERGIFQLLMEQDSMKPEQMVEYLGANDGHFQVALRMLLSLNWLCQCEDGRYVLTTEAVKHAKIPPNVLEFYQWDMEAYLMGEGGLLGKWIELSQARWNLADPLLADFLDGVLLVPLLLAVKKHQLWEQTRFHDLSFTIREELSTLFVGKGWAQREADNFSLTDMGRFMVDRAFIMGVAASYRPMLSQIGELLFGNPEVVFQRNADGHEQHLDRTLNVVASGFQHDKYFVDIEETILSVFNRLPLEEQPKYVADMGCGDGHLLARVYETIRLKSARGKVLDQHPVSMIGVDYNEESLNASSQTLANVPHRVLQGDIGNPSQLIANLKLHAINPEEVLHIRSFLDHDRRFIPPEDEGAVQARANLPLEEVYVDSAGHSIAPHVMVQSLVEHFTRWAKVVNKHGLVIVEVHSLPARTVSRFLDESENLHFDALQAFSSQHLVSAPVFLLAAAEAGLFVKPQFSRRYPKTLPFTRITSSYFEKRHYRIRHPRGDDLVALVNLETRCWPEPLRASTQEIQQRVERFPQGHCVLEMEGQVVGVIYSQRLANADTLEQSNYREVSSLHTPQGSIIQLLSVNVLPEMQHYGLGDQLLEFMLQYSTLESGIERAVGVTLCKNYSDHAAIPMEEYIQQRNPRGERLDPILRFHESHGAKIGKIIEGYRPEDIANQGKGVFIEYDLRSRQRKQFGNSSASVANAEKEQRSVSMQVGEVIRYLLEQKSQYIFSPEQTLASMGLDSMDLMELNVLLSERFDIKLDNNFFLRYRTPDSISHFLQGKNKPGNDRNPGEPAITDHEELASFHDASAEVPQIHAVVTEQQQRKLLVDGRWVYDFASCNYLGLDLHPEVMASILPAIEKWGVHPSWTRAVASPAIYDELEQELADLVGAPSVLVFSAITLLHMGVLPVLAGHDGVIFKDISAHRSIDEACRLAQTGGAKFINFRHNDVEDLERKLAHYPYEQTKIIAIDGVYSMSGAYPPLPEFARLAKQYNAWVYMDDAHGMGIIGENPTPERPYGHKGNGIVRYYGMDYANDRLIYVSGLSKSYSSFGAFITCVDEEMKNRFKAASTFIFSGPSPVASLATAIAGLKLNRREGEQWREQVYKLTYKLVTEAKAMGFEVINDNFFPIVCIVIGKTNEVVTACKILWEYGILITPALFPIVPMDQGLLRFSITAVNTEEQIDRVLEALQALGA